MVGQGLTRYAVDQPFLLFDTETTGLNLAYSVPWELSFAIATLKGGLGPIQTRLIRWPDLRFSADNPSAAHFDRARYDREAREPCEVWNEFGTLLYSGKYRAAGHNLIGYDCFVVNTWRRLMGIPSDYSWLYSPPVLDTNCIAKAYRGSWVPDVSSPEAFVAWQYRCYNTRLAKGVKTRLGAMCAEFKIEYDEKRAHEAAYDLNCNWLVAKELIWKVEC